mmetsp:Transcript_45378/g.109913  ORF Transcript_45378/g.109913 Transcript_45378/m.109913 type:complete len:275 (-) Transcript_45378:1190-2014(-)
MPFSKFSATINDPGHPIPLISCILIPGLNPVKRNGLFFMISATTIPPLPRLSLTPIGSCQDRRCTLNVRVRIGFSGSGEDSETFSVVSEIDFSSVSRFSVSRLGSSSSMISVEPNPQNTRRKKFANPLEGSGDVTLSSSTSTTSRMGRTEGSATPRCGAAGEMLNLAPLKAAVTSTSPEVLLIIKTVSGTVFGQRLPLTVSSVILGFKPDAARSLSVSILEMRIPLSDLTKLRAKDAIPSFDSLHTTTCCEASSSSSSGASLDSSSGSSSSSST